MKTRTLSLLLLLGVNIATASNMEYEINFVGMKMDYKEYGRSGTLLDSEKSAFSDILGSELKYRYFVEERSFVEASVLGVGGTTDYVGSLIGSGLGYGSYTSTTSNTVWDLALSYNRVNETMFPNINVLGGLGMGYRYWERELSSSQKELYTWYSLRARVGLLYTMQDVTFAFMGEYQYGIDPTMTASNISGDFKLGAADIIELSLPIHYRINEKFDLSCAYVWSRQKIRESNVVSGYYEPDSTAYNQYLKLGIVFKY